MKDSPTSRFLFCLCIFILFQLSLSKVPKNVTEIIIGYGYPCESYLTEPTSDGWRLSVQRIPHGLKNANSTHKGVVFFMHGLTDTSVGINLNSPTESLSFILADEGFDVWMGNNRGNGVSTINTLYSSKSKEYWDFSWDEMASTDLPAMVDMVLQKTNATKLSLIGHSEGTIQSFAALTSPDRKKLSSRLNTFIALAPVAYVQHVESFLIQLLVDLHVDDIFEILGIKEFDLPKAIDLLIPGFCDLNKKLCAFGLGLICGPTTFLNDSRIPYYSHFEPNPTSVKNMVHWAQGVQKGTFSKYDYGSKRKNQQHYNQPTPPQYELQYFPTQTEMPLALFTGGHDYLADPKDVARLLSLLPTPPFVHEEPDYAHLDPLLGFNAYQRIYPIIVKLLLQANTPGSNFGVF